MTFDLIDQSAQIQSQIVEYLNLEEDNDEMFEKLIELFTKYQIGREKYELELLLCLLVRIFNNMHRTSTFFDKIFKILNYIKEDISKIFTNKQIYEIFESNNRLLLFLIDERILTVDQNIASKLLCKAAKYFYIEIQPFGYLTDIKYSIDKSEFERLRKNGEDHQKICELIRNDLLDDFIVFINQYCIKSTKIIKIGSIFETNQYLQKRPNSLIEYAAFFGSIKIFIYLRDNDAELKPSSILFAIHGQNAEIIDFLLNKFPN